jgi:hypothetical protein
METLDCTREYLKRRGFKDRIHRINYIQKTRDIILKSSSFQRYLQMYPLTFN